MFGYGILWIVFAIVTIAAKYPNIKFSMAWWGFTFPLGTTPPPKTLLPLNCPLRIAFSSLLLYQSKSVKRPPILCPLFTIGTFSLLCSQLGTHLPSLFFNVVSTIITACVVLLWMLVAFRTTVEGWKGEIFFAPCLVCLADMPPLPTPQRQIEMANRQNGVDHSAKRTEGACDSARK